MPPAVWVGGWIAENADAVQLTFLLGFTEHTLHSKSALALTEIAHGLHELRITLDSFRRGNRSLEKYPAPVDSLLKLAAKGLQHLEQHVGVIYAAQPFADNDRPRAMCL